MPTSHENIVRWINQSNIDYTTYFIKAWIPFNAWYDLHYHNQANMDSDRAKINAIKNTPNPARNGINTLLEGDSQQSYDLRNFLAGLHHALQQHQLDGNDGRISFHEIVKERNQTNQTNDTYNGTRYFLQRTDGNRLGEVNQIQVILSDRNNNAFFNYQHNSYDLAHLQANQNFLNLSQARQENTRLRFQNLHPITVIDAIQDANNLQNAPSNYYKCDSYNFKRDNANPNCFGHIVCRGLIETLYQLRNQLFHGELTPSQGCQPIYRNAYFLLKMILERVR